MKAAEGDASRSRDPRSAGRQRAELARVHACRARRTAGRSGPAGAARAEDRAGQSVVPRFARVGRYFQQGRLDQADAPLTQAAAKLQTSSVVQEHLGDLRFKQQRFADAASAWERALSGRRPVSRPSQDREEDSRRTLPHGPSVIPSSRAVGICRATLAAVLGLCAFVSACGPKAPALPSGGGAAFPDAASAYAEATSQCRGVRTLSAELALSGRAGRQKLRGRVLGGFCGARTRPARGACAVRAAGVHPGRARRRWRRSC